MKYHEQEVEEKRFFLKRGEKNSDHLTESINRSSTYNNDKNKYSKYMNQYLDKYNIQHITVVYQNPNPIQAYPGNTFSSGPIS